jgi:hypothetical protein
MRDNGEPRPGGDSERSDHDAGTRPPIGDPDDSFGDADFAGEHDDASLVGDRPGGPEGADEEVTPRGLAGQD